MKVEDCGARKHKYEFLGNKVFTTTTSGPRGSTVKASVNALYKCTVCGKSRRGPGNANHPWPDLFGGTR